jgi:hypothetical protein
MFEKLSFMTVLNTEETAIDAQTYLIITVNGLITVLVVKIMPIS